MMPEVMILLSDRRMSKLMQDADVFEKFKVILLPAVRATVVADFGDSNVKAILRNLESGNQSLVAIYNDKVVFYRDPDVKCVSNGKTWCLLDDLLPTNVRAEIVNA